MKRVAVFGGTVEGRELSRYLAGYGVAASVFVATAYGEETLEPLQGITVRTGRMNADEMADCLREEDYDCVVDATHPYAERVTDHLREACERVGMEYFRLFRAGSSKADARYAPNAPTAATLLNQISGNALLTIGSKELEAFVGVDGWRNRFYVRVLPDPEVVSYCVKLGFRGRNLICMQGPFSREMNAATLRMLNIQVLVTKDSGAAGGFPEKLSAAKECGCEVLIISRPSQTPGLDFRGVVDLLTKRFELPDFGRCEGNGLATFAANERDETGRMIGSLIEKRGIGV